VVSVLVFTVGALLLKHKRFKWASKYFGGLIAMAAFNGMYIFFLESSPDHHKAVIQAAMFMNVFAFHMLVFRFWKESLFLSLSLIGVYTVASVSGTPQAQVYQSLTFWCLVMTVFFWVQRTEFVATLDARFKSLLLQYPPKIARAMTLVGDEAEYLEAFAPKRRPCVCLCVDWRSFQEMASRKSPEEIATLIEKSHEVLLKFVYKNIPNESFHADWTADEFFLMLYSERDSKEELLKGAVNIVKNILEDFYQEMSKSSSQLVPTIDVGVAFGEGVLGLLGPKNMKKLTVAGSIGGRAKRLETEAKTVRDEKSLSEGSIVVAVDFDVFFYCANSEREWAEQFDHRLATTKNIKNDAIYVIVGTKKDRDLEVKQVS
jgi:hypothetical protein